jgi:hypothetical protein
VVHHSDSDFGDADTIRRWHEELPNIGRMGYHFVILNGRRAKAGMYDKSLDGIVERGIEDDRPGVHAKGHNATSLGICLIGGPTFTRLQFLSLLTQLRTLNDQYMLGVEAIVGHCELDPVNKPFCPGFSMELVRAALAYGRRA